MLNHGDTIRVGGNELLFLVYEGETGDSPQLFLSDDSSVSDLKTIRVDETTPLPHLGVEVGRLARDLDAVFRISEIINSIRDISLLQRELLRLIFEVIPAEKGAIVLISQANQEPESICAWGRESGGRPRSISNVTCVHRALWSDRPCSQAQIEIRAIPRACCVCRLSPWKGHSASSTSFPTARFRHSEKIMFTS